MADDDAKSTKTTKTAKTEVTEAPRASIKPTEEEEGQRGQEEEGGFKEFLWNSETKEFLGRNGKSWLDITIFYIVFFLSLYCFFMMSWYISLMFIDPAKPYKVGKNVAILQMRDKGPGLTYRPVPDKYTNGISSLIWFKTGSADDFKYWTEQLQSWMRMAQEAGAKFGKIDYIKNTYGECAGPVAGPGYFHFGYPRGEPCILLKLNRIYGFEPEKIKAPDDIINAKVSIPFPLDDEEQNKKVWVWCEGEHPHDKENLGSIEYFPGPWFDGSLFPLKFGFKKENDQRLYQSPFVMIKLRRPMKGTLISITCDAYAGNVKSSKLTGTASLRFQVFIG